MPFLTRTVSGFRRRQASRSTSAPRKALVRPPLLAQLNFRNLWFASIVSDFGAYVSALAIPLTAALTLHVSPFQMGILTSMEYVPFLAFGLFAGVLVDRLPRKHILIISDVARAIALAVIPILAVAGYLRFSVLVTVALIVGLFTLMFQVGETSVMPSIIHRDDLVAANSRFSVSGSAGQAGGPALAGLLASLLGPPIAVAVNSLSFLVSATFLRAIDVPAHEDAPASTGREPAGVIMRRTLAEIRDGLHIVYRQVALRASILGIVMVNLFGYMFLAVYLLYMARTLHFSEVTIGLILAGGGLGAVVAALLSHPLRVRFGFGPTMVWSMAICGVTSLLIPVAVGVPSMALPLLAAAECIQYGALAIFNIGGRTLRQVVVPNAYQGRASATSRMLAGSATLIGSLSGGLLGEVIGLGPTLVIGALGMMTGIPIVWFSPLRTMVHLPASADDPVG